MPEPYKRKPYPLSNLIAYQAMVRVECRYCKRRHNYYPEDLIRIFGDVDVDSLMDRMKCENGGSDHGRMDVKSFTPTGSESVGLRIRRLVRIEFRRVPVWKDEP